ncbi:MAG: phosphoenolpyruvate carboxylase [Bacteroidetes bacterium]|nr:phosphoenolpyruvate carboxylase [Bacteroidota bacterium]
MATLEKFQNNVAVKYQIFNSLFLTLPFEEVTNIGVTLPLLFQDCKDGFEHNRTPQEIVDQFFKKRTKIKNEEEINLLIFKFIQYIERQVVLFDAIEDSAFEKINDLDGQGTIKYLFSRSQNANRMEKLVQKLKDFKVRPVLTAHPTQFYPSRVLSIINDLEVAIRKNDLRDINDLLRQLGRTPFVTKEKPTPLDEAMRLMWYLEYVFYHSIPKIHSRMRKQMKLAGVDVDDFDNNLIDLGFWPGGDRDGNHFVTADITRKVASELKQKVFICYYRDLRNLRKRLTFSGIDERIEIIYNTLSNTIFNTDGKRYHTKEDLLKDLNYIRVLIVEKHNGLFIHLLDELIWKVKIFGFHFALLDVRQDSRIHGKVLSDVFEAMASGKLKDSVRGKIPKNYEELSEAKKIAALLTLEGNIDPDLFEDDMTKETLKSLYVIRDIQKANGEIACHRYIISNTQTAVNMFEVYALARICGWEKEMTLDIVPLFETIDDLVNANDIMATMYGNDAYEAQLKFRGKKQYIMLGFSDGTKDGGYLMANWSIFRAKENLTEIARKNKVSVVFFDGRGGPPARGGGNTNKFYSSLGDRIEDDEIQLTVQGQTISSNFGTVDSSQYNIEQLICAGLENFVFKGDILKLSDKNRELIDDMAKEAYDEYCRFKNDPKFIDYLEEVSVLQYYGKTNIGSRPSKRKKADKLTLSDLRAIPFVGAWTQMKQNVPGFFGFGTAIKKYKDAGRIDEIKDLYQKSLFFRTLAENSMMSLSKTYFPLTAYLANDKKFGKFWKWIHDEYTITKALLLEISGMDSLLENQPSNQASIQMRENIILPLITIQQYALMNLKDIEKGERKDAEMAPVFEKMIIRAFFGSINASRNSA